MTIPTIHVHTQVDKSTVPYAKFMWETVNSLANHPELLKITVHCMGPTAEARSTPWIQRGNTIVVPSRKGDTLHGSYGHGACVASALALTGDGSIHVIADSDTVVIARGWDDYLRKRLLDDGIGIIGTTYEALGGFSSGTSTVQTYKKIPTLTWCALTPMHDWRTLNVMPNKAHQVAISSPQLSQIYNLPEGYVVFGEVGWQIPQYLQDNALKYEGWQQLKPARDAVVLKGLSNYHEEYHVQGVPFLVHHRGSLRHAYRGDRISNLFYGTVDKYLQAELPRPPRWTWKDSGIVSTIPVFSSQPAPEATPPKVEVAPEAYVPQDKEWLKVTFNGGVISPKRGIDRTTLGTPLEFTPPPPQQLGHLRVEGTLEHVFPLVLPPVQSEPYTVIVRNLTGAPLLVTCDRGNNVHVPAGKAWLVLVDVDGVQHVE